MTTSDPNADPQDPPRIDPAVAHDVAAYALAARAADIPGDPPTVSVTGDPDKPRLVVSHRTLRGTGAQRTGIGVAESVRTDPSGSAGPVPSGRLVRFLDQAVADIRRRRQRDDELRAAGHIPAGHDDRGNPVTRPPDWSILVHPLMLHAMLRARHAHDHVPHAAGDPPTGASTTLEHDLMLGGVMSGSDPEDRSTWALRPHATTTTCGLTVLRPLPESIAQALAGRPLADLVALPTCGRPEVDDAVASLVIRKARTTGSVATIAPPGGGPAKAVGPFPNPTDVTLEPAIWLTLAPMPEGVHARFHIDHPYMR